MKKTITFKEFGEDFKRNYKCKDVLIRDGIEAETVFLDLYECDCFEFDYDKKTIDLYF